LYLSFPSCLRRPLDLHSFPTRRSSDLFVPVTVEIGERAAELRAQYNVTLTDALQIATAIVSGCDALLTNDLDLKRVQDIRSASQDRKSTRLNSSHEWISYAVFCLKKKR